MHKLFIYDTADEDNKEQAEERFGKDPSIYHLPVASQDDLTASLKGLLALEYQFDRVLVQTHGGPGEVSFGDKSTYGWYFDETLPAVMDISALFPFYTRIYFDGCNVADGGMGTAFITRVGKGLLKKRGGEVFAWTSPGYAFPSFWTAPIITPGHTLHFSGYLKRAFFVQGKLIKIIEGES